jgi:hypothetical protein
MLFLILRIYENIIDEHHYELVEVVMNTLFIKYMKKSWRIHHTEGHYCVFIKPILGDECCLWYVRRSDPELMIT